MKILVSACLTGQNCKYNGGNNFSEKLKELGKKHTLIPVCPEVLGGLPIPRTPAEIVDGIVTARDGTVVDSSFRRGAELALHTALREKIDFAILQSRSPSCGAKQIYDGSFSGTRIDGEGVFAALLKKNGFKVIDIEDLITDKY